MSDTASDMAEDRLSDISPWTVDKANSQWRSVKSAERTLALFELFSLHQQPMSIGEMAQRLNIPQPSVSMLVRNLVQLGYLEHDRTSRNYLPTIRIMLLGSWIHRQYRHQGDVETHLDDLMSQVQETVFLGIQNGIYSQYVSAQLPDVSQRLEVQSGLLRPITRTALGRVLLSLKSKEEVALIVRRSNAETQDEAERVDPREFEALLANVREKGYAETSGDMSKNYSAFAVAIKPTIGQIPMAIGVGGRTDRIMDKRDLVIAALFAAKAKLEPNISGDDGPD
ncbi:MULTISPECIES: IclR family transcriptional regulator [Sphingobium]|uniref:IclR family transcriptional regulator n=1 Tax=Sphingobium TaxID=165695 RepID=UPI00159BFC89|nr:MULTISPECIES: helix-turn-helix domain-containing protein [unclassified Sphingobium]